MPEHARKIQIKDIHIEITDTTTVAVLFFLTIHLCLLKMRLTAAEKCTPNSPLCKTLEMCLK